MLGKVAGTGGAITVRTAKEQLLYEVTDPGGYVTPDVIADFTGVSLAQTAVDRVSVHGGRGRARTPTYKVSVGYRAGFVGEGEVSYAGARARERAQLAGDIVRERLREDLPDLRIDLIGIDSAHRSDFGHPHAPYEARLRVAARTPTRELAQRVGGGNLGAGNQRARRRRRLPRGHLRAHRRGIDPARALARAPERDRDGARS